MESLGNIIKVGTPSIGAVKVYTTLSGGTLPEDCPHCWPCPRSSAICADCPYQPKEGE